MVESEDGTREAEKNGETRQTSNTEEEENVKIKEISDVEVEENQEAGPLDNKEARPLRRSPRIRNIKNIKFVKSANTQEERMLSVKDNDSEGIKYMFFMNTLGTSHVFTTNMIGTSQNEGEEEIYEILATEIPLTQ